MESPFESPESLEPKPHMSELQAKADKEVAESYRKIFEDLPNIRTYKVG